VERERSQDEATGIARSAVGGKSAQSGLARGGPLPMQAESLLSLQQSFGNRAVARLVQRWRDKSGDAVSPAGLANGYGRRDQVVQRTFDHKGKKKDKDVTKLPTIQRVPPKALRSLADDEVHHGVIETQQQFATAWAAYELSHAKPVVVVPLAKEQDGNVTVGEEETQFAGPLGVAQTQYTGSVRMTLQVDQLQGKHDQPFMKKHSTVPPRKMGDNQMRRSLAQYQALARGAPLQLAKEQLADIFKKNERVPLDFSVMAAQQSDGLYYEISAKWATEEGRPHVLVYYHCFPDEKDQKKFGFGK
jgi:hypothetical protein